MVEISCAKDIVRNVVFINKEKWMFDFSGKAYMEWSLSNLIKIYIERILSKIEISIELKVLVQQVFDEIPQINSKWTESTDGQIDQPSHVRWAIALTINRAFLSKDYWKPAMIKARDH